MADQIGVLGEATTATAGTTTVYTVPSAKAAKVKIMWSGLSHAATGTGDLTITVNGIDVAVVLLCEFVIVFPFHLRWGQVGRAFICRFHFQFKDLGFSSRNLVIPFLWTKPKNNCYKYIYIFRNTSP